MPRAKVKTLSVEPAAPEGSKRETGRAHSKQILIPIAYRPVDAAHVLGVCRSTVYRMITDGELEARQIGGVILIRHNDLLDLVDGASLSPHTKFAKDRAGRS